MTNKFQNNNDMTNAAPILSSNKFEQLLSLLTFKFFSVKPAVAVLRLEGVIGKVGAFKTGLTINSLNNLIEKAFKINNLKALCLVINSPGGAPVQAELITNRIIELAAEKDIPVYSFVEDVAASGGYWLACAADKIFVSRSSVIGSIGVIASGFGFSEAIKKIGVERRIYTQGKNKSILDPFMPEKESDSEIVKKVQKEIHEHFISVVKERRKGRLTQSDDILFNGEFWSGQTAIDYGLVDGINNLNSFIKNKFGDEVKIEYIEPKQSWLKKKFGLGGVYKELGDNIAAGLIDEVESKIQKSKFDFF